MQNWFIRVSNGIHPGYRSFLREIGVWNKFESSFENLIWVCCVNFENRSLLFWKSLFFFLEIGGCFEIWNQSCLESGPHTDFAQMVDQTAFDIKNDKKVFHLFFFRSTAAFNVFFYKWQTANKLKVSYQRQYFEDRIENRRFPSREHSNPLQNQVALLAQSVMRPAERKDTAGSNFRDCSNVGLRYSPDKSLSCGYKYKGNQLWHLLDSTIHQFKQLGPDLY